jgi:hypothetical protein
VKSGKGRYLFLLMVFFLAGVHKPLLAHHSVAAEFDSNKEVTLTGVISKVQWINPHVFVYLDVKDETGKVTTWELQSQPTRFFHNSGLTKEKLMDKEEVMITVFLAKDGTKAYGYLYKITYPDGHYYQLISRESAGK